MTKTQPAGIREQSNESEHFSGFKLNAQARNGQNRAFGTRARTYPAREGMPKGAGRHARRVNLTRRAGTTGMRQTTNISRD